MSEARKPAEGSLPLTAERLRELASTPGLVVEFLSITGPEAAMLADALEIADSCARSDIESFCGGTFEPRWYDTTNGDSAPFTEYEEKAVAQALRYLNARGLIEKDPEREGWVRFRETPE